MCGRFSGVVHEVATAVSDVEKEALRKLLRKNGAKEELIRRFGDSGASKPHFRLPESAEAAESQRSDVAESTGDTTSSTMGDTTSSTRGDTTSSTHAPFTLCLSLERLPLPPSRTLVLES
jgi:Arc/MetJ-type ribon-helix-helix transcriptional regulator